MIVYALLKFLVDVVNIFFGWLPAVETLPQIVGYDIDTALVSGVSMFYTFADIIWPIKIVMQGFMWLVGYYSIKLILRIFLGHRAPGGFYH